MLYLFGATGIHPAAELKVVVKKKSFLFPSLSSAMHYSTSTIAHNNDIHTHTHYFALSKDSTPETLSFKQMYGNSNNRVNPCL